MAILPFNLHGYLFQKGVDDIRQAYDATIAALKARHENAQSELVRLRKAIADDELGPIEYSEEGEELYDKETLQEMMTDDAAVTISMARNSYIVLLHHHWEKRCDVWMRSKNYCYKNAYKWLERRGINVDKVQLDVLRRGSNTIKHNNRELFDEAAALFEFSGGVPGTDIANALRLDETHVDKLFGAVSRSGPNVDSAIF